MNSAECIGNANAKALEASRQRALQRFRAPTATLFLRAVLPDELVYHIRQFLYNSASTQRSDHRMAMLMLTIAHRRASMKRCTPCAHCHRQHCYSSFCHTCDAMLCGMVAVRFCSQFM